MMILAPLKGHTNEINHVIIGNNGYWAISASDDGNVLEWDLASKAFKLLYSHGSITYALDLSVDNYYITSGASSGELIFYSYQESKIL